MTQFPALPSAPFGQVRIGQVRIGQVRIGPVAARTLTAEFDRHAGPKTGLLVAVTIESAVLTAAIDALLPDDQLAVVVPDAASGAVLRSHLNGLGRWVADRVRVLHSLSRAEPVDVIVVAEPLTGTAEEARTRVEELAKLLAPGGIADGRGGRGARHGRRRACRGRAEPAGRALRRRLDLVLRNAPPLRVHRLRFSAAQTATAGRLAPAYRPSSVPVTRDMHIDSNGIAAAGLALGWPACCG
jgi:phosphatidylserine decarboxylase